MKIGAITNSGQADVIFRFLRRHSGIAAVYDPVIVPTNGVRFVSRRDSSRLKRLLLSSGLNRITLLTPNLDEYRWLFGNRTPEAVTSDHKCHLLLKGGHGSGTHATDRLYHCGKLLSEHSRKRTKLRIHGTGCVLSSLTAAYIARGISVRGAVKRAEMAMDRLITGAGPLAPHGKAILFH